MDHKWPKWGEIYAAKSPSIILGLREVEENGPIQGGGKWKSPAMFPTESGWVTYQELLALVPEVKKVKYNGPQEGGKWPLK
jgi:hypothetical protein